MGHLSCLVDLDKVLVADASAAINLNATGCAKKILKALSRRVVVVDVVAEEIEEGRTKGRRDADHLDELVNEKFVDIVKLGPIGSSHFENLVIGPAHETLDDGEAATIAYALETNALALIDEKKAIRICGERFPALRLAATVDLLAHDDVQRELGTGLSLAVIGALQGARMRVLPRHLSWVVDVIGAQQVALCRSLPASARTPPNKRAAKKR